MGLAALQVSAGNAAVVQMLREAGHSWAQEQHEHSDGCGHQQTEHAAQPAVQRSTVHDVLRTPGRPLDASVRTDMESRLRADFSDVRLHTDSVAKASAAEVGARAYTSGNHIVVGDGGTDRHTLAHELTHVIQQRQGPVAGTDNGGGLKVSDPSDRFEREAEANAHRVLAAQPASDFSVQRSTDSSHVLSGSSTVQRVAYPQGDDVQDVLKQSFWEREGGGKGAVMDGKRAAMKNKATSKKGKKPKPRTLTDIVGGIASDLLRDLAAKPQGSGELKLYRGMSSAEADAVLAWAGAESDIDSPRARTEAWVRDNPKASAADWHGAKQQIVPTGTHLGDQKQAHNYVASNAGFRMLEFTLKPGAHELLFDPQYTALASVGDAPAAIEAAIGGHVAASENEGTLGGYIGIKSEREGYFSVNPGKSQQVGGEWKQTPGHLLFQMFLKGVREVTGEYDPQSLTATRLSG